MLDDEATGDIACTGVAFEGLIVHQGGFVLEVSHQFAQMFGYDPSELPGRNIYRLLAGESVAKAWSRVDQEDASVYTAVGRRKDGSVFPIRISARSITIEGQTARVAAVSDLTRECRDLGTHDNIRHVVQQALLQTVDTLNRMIETRDRHTAGHQSRTAVLADAIARELGMSRDEVLAINLGATIHDVGKVGVPKDILMKPGRLNDEELTLMRTHAQRGYEIVSHLDWQNAVPDIVLHHHERLDGSGYPDALGDGQVRAEVRVVAVADVLEALTARRPYRAGYDLDTALSMVSEGAGSIYDADVVSAAKRVLQDERVQLGN